MRISPFDFAIVLVYLAGITLFGAHFRRGQQTLRDYFLGGRTAPWWAIACSIVATETSTLTIIGTPAIAFGGNLGFLQLVLGYLVARVILCVVLIPQYFHGEFYTAYQLLEKRFGVRMKQAAAVVFMVTRALAEGVRISAIGKVVSVAFGTGDRLSIAIVAALTLFYTFEGGMRAVIWTDVLQLRALPHRLRSRLPSPLAQNSRRLARCDANGGRVRWKAARLRFRIQPHAQLHVLVRPHRRNFLDDGEPRHRSDDGATAARCAQRTRQQNGATRQRRDRLRAIRAFSGSRRDALRLRAARAAPRPRRRYRPHLSRIYRARNACGPGWIGSGVDLRRSRCPTQADR